MTEEESLRQAIIDNPRDLVRCFVYADWLEDHGRTDDAARLRETAGFERRVRLSKASDRRHSDPDKNYGVSDVKLNMALIGPRGAVTFTAFTRWYLPHVEMPASRRAEGCDVSYHAKRPMHEGQAKSRDDCEYTGGVCYSDGSALAADEVFDVLLREGDEGVWKYLRAVYRDRFGE